MFKINKNFKIGGAISAEQVEGRKGFENAITVWDEYFKQRPDHFYNKIGPCLGIDFITNYKEDISLFQEMGMEELRISVSWAKIFDGKHSGPNKKALDFYHNVINELNNAGIDVLLTIYHFDTPLWVFKQAELKDKEFIDLYFNFAKFVVDEFGSKVKKIITFNEPVGQLERSYLKGNRHWPLQQNFQHFVDGLFNVLVCHKLVAEYIKEKSISAESGIVLNLRLSIPENKSKPNLIAAHKYDVLFTDFLLFPIALNKLHPDLLPLLEELNVNVNLTDKDLKLINSISTDIIGINYYRPRRVVVGKDSDPAPFHLFGELTDFSNYRYNKDRGMEIFPEGMEIICNDFINKYNNHKFYISENGMGKMEETTNAQIDDSYRISYLKEHIRHLIKGVNKGANCVAYHIWSPIDNWSWGNEYKNRYGLISVDINTMKRSKKKSFEFYKNLIKNRII